MLFSEDVQSFRSFIMNNNHKCDVPLLHLLHFLSGANVATDLVFLFLITSKYYISHFSSFYSPPIDTPVYVKILLEPSDQKNYQYQIRLNTEKYSYSVDQYDNWAFLFTFIEYFSKIQSGKSRWNHNFINSWYGLKPHILCWIGWVQLWHQKW